MSRINYAVSRFIAPSAVALSTVFASSAAADDVKDVVLQGGTSIRYQATIVRNYDPGSRCDVTSKLVGGTASAVMFEYQNLFVNTTTGWSPWLRMNETFSNAYFGDSAILVNVWSAQADRPVVVRFRIAGNCQFTW